MDRYAHKTGREPSEQQLLYNAENIAYLLSVSTSKARLLMKEMPVVRIGRSVRVSKQALEQWLANRSL